MKKLLALLSSPALATTLACNSWNFKPASCDTSVKGAQIALASDQSGGDCKLGNWKPSVSALGTTVINVINGCRGTFLVVPPASPIGPPVYAVSPVNGLLNQVVSLSGQAPFSVHLSALTVNSNTCSFNQTAWRAAGMHNICDLDKSAFSVVTTPLAQNFLNGPTPVSQSCFIMPPNGAPYDVNTTKLVNQLLACVGSAENAANGQAYLNTYSWNFGDSGSPFNAVNGFNAAHVYYKPGTYTITMNGASIKVLVTPNTRTPVVISTQAQMNALAAIGNEAKLSNRWIQIAPGNYTIPSSIFLYSGDWVTAQNPTIPPVISSPTGATMFNFPWYANSILVEKLSIQNPTEGPMFAAVDGPIENIVFKDIVFHGLKKGFDISGNGILIQNVGSAQPWTDLNLQMNFALYSSNVIAFYGNNVYVAASDNNGEPGIRANGGQLVSIVGNNIGGWIGKGDEVSFRGAQNVYFGSNNLRGGVLNTQDGVGQDPQPGNVVNSVVLENNTVENSSFEIAQGGANFRISGNTFTMEPYSAAVYALYPPQQGHLTNIGGNYFSAVPTNVLVTGNTYIDWESRPGQYGELMRLAGNTNFTLQNNVFWSAAFQPFSGAPYPWKVGGNTFYLKALNQMPVGWPSGDNVKLNTAWTPQAN